MWQAGETNRFAYLESSTASSAGTHAPCREKPLDKHAQCCGVCLPTFSAGRIGIMLVLRTRSPDANALSASRECQQCNDGRVKGGSANCANCANPCPGSRFADAVPGDVERRQEKQRQQGGDDDAADHGEGH